MRVSVYAPGTQGFRGGNLPPPYLQSFGMADVSATGVLDVKLMSVTGAVLYSKTLQPDLTDQCNVTVKVYDADTDAAVMTVPNGGTLATPPCDINIEVVLTCTPGFNYRNVFIELLSGTNVVRRRQELAGPYFLFSNEGRDVLRGSINPGTYSVRVSAGGKTFAPSVMTLGTCK